MVRERERTRPVSEPLGRLAVVWLVASIGLIWLWSARPMASAELAFWDAAARTALEASHPIGVVLAVPPLPLSLVMMMGDARWAALSWGLASLALLLLLGRSGRAWIWMLPLLLHPVIVLGALAFPARLITTMVLAGALVGFVEYVRSDALAPLTYGALLLGLLTLAGGGTAWPIWLMVAATMATLTGRGAGERWTVVLVALFPALFLSAGWFYLHWTEGGASFALVPPLASRAWGGNLVEPVAATATEMVAGVRSWTITLASFALALPLLLAPGMLAAGLPALAGARDVRRTLAGSLLLAAPLVWLAVERAQGHAGTTSAALGLTLAALIASARLTAYAPGYGPVVALCLAASVAGAWTLGDGQAAAVDLLRHGQPAARMELP